MPISPNYVVQYLLESSRPGMGSIGWYEKDAGFAGHLHGLDLFIESVPVRPGALACLTISSLPERVHVWEPPRDGIFSRKYKNEHDERLAGLLNELLRAAAKQCALRESRPDEISDTVRDAMFRRLIGVDELMAEETPELSASYR